MIGDPETVTQLLVQLQAELPIPVTPTNQLVRVLREQRVKASTERTLFIQWCPATHLLALFEATSRRAASSLPISLTVHKRCRGNQTTSPTAPTPWLSKRSVQMQRTPINLDDLIDAFTQGSPELLFYLDRETGEVVLVDDETRTVLEGISEALDDEHGEEQLVFEEALRQADVPDWMRAALVVAHQVEQGDGDRYLAIPTDDTREAYGDMEAFIDATQDRRLQVQLGCHKWRYARRSTSGASRRRTERGF